MSNPTTEVQKTAAAAPAPMLVGRMGVQLNTLEDMHRFAKWACEAGFAPKNMDTPIKCAIAIQKGMEIGVPPLYAIQNIAVINGRPCIYGDIGLSLIRASGHLASIVESVEGDKDMIATCTICRRGEQPRTFTFSQTDATRAGLWGKEGPWKTYPKRMLMFRARWFALRDVFGDVLAGISGREEFEGMTIETEAEVVETTVNKRKGKPTIADIRNEAMSTPPPEFDEPEQVELPQGREPGEEG